MKHVAIARLIAMLAMILWVVFVVVSHPSEEMHEYKLACQGVVSDTGFDRKCINGSTITAIPDRARLTKIGKDLYKIQTPEDRQ